MLNDFPVRSTDYGVSQIFMGCSDYLDALLEETRSHYHRLGASRSEARAVEPGNCLGNV